MLDVIILIVAGLAAGALNAVAGGGTFLSFPALVWVGVPPIMANATATLAALPGYVGSTWGFRHDIGAGGGGRLGVRLLALVAALGGVLGALLLLVTPGRVFDFVIPWLLLISTIVFAAGPYLVRRLTGDAGGVGRPVAILLILGVAICGGYFNGGLGIMLLAALGFAGFADLNRMNGLKNLASTILSAVAVATYALSGLIDWSEALLLGTACAFGGYFGAILARRVRSMALLRGFITLVGGVMSVIFFLRAGG